MKITDDQKKENIEEIQGYLRKISVARDDFDRLVVNGKYDDRTAKAVRKIQSEYKIPVTGEVDGTTWNAIIKEYEKAKKFTEAAEKISPYNENEVVLSRGDAGYIIYILQVMLGTIGQFYDNISSPKIVGIYDIETENAVKEVQEISPLEVTGEVDYKTWNTIAKLYNFHALLDDTEKMDLGGSNSVG